ncbi:plexin-A3-like [Acyrthosiphon pisum]|uniref:IPT/TIG domain-containing protein n=1 Tax=Acyrthosiphon pisum TaxID=7029 RepID=A0A8R2B7W5_ACYPI|nr:plexin-A3-like [Acyrthosiphon pisum]|eukprot:XP_008185550.1 PREDICTED: plexin-A3-like [Acyrthosiphon pisum]
MSCADPTDTKSINTITINCSGLKTCKKCAENPSCLWSLERQACFVDYETSLMLAVRKEFDCPSVSVASSVTYVSHLPYVYILNVINDVTGFLEFLDQTRVWCVMLDVTRPAGVYGDTIRCAPVNQTDLGFEHQTLMTYHFYVIFGDGDTILRLDDGADSYVTVYNEYHHHSYRPDESCVTCLWDVGQFAYFYKWCPSRNLATGRYRFYVGYSDTDHRAVMPANDRLLATVPASSGCNDVHIQSVEPLSGLWTGGQKVMVKVNNYVTLADGKGEVNVTVAGRDCMRPTMVDFRNSRITCLLTAASHDYMRPPAEEQGPVVITFQASSLTVESTQTFRFVYPEITEIGPSCGPLTGSTLLTVRGRNLDAGSLVTIAVTVGDGAPVPCELVARHSNRILCLTGPSKRPATGAVSVVFDKTLRVQNDTAGVPLAFIYAAEPVLAAGQQLEGIASGGIAMPVRGTGFACVSDATMYVDRGGVRRVADGHCHPVNDTYMICGTPKLDGPTAGALPERLRFGFHVWHADGHVSDMPPPPDTDGYMAHADPVLEDFVVLPTGRSMLINGPDLGHGYEAAEVMVVQLSKNLTAAACNVTAVTPRHIVCESDSLDGLNGFPVIVVTIGDQLAYTVNRRVNNGQPESFRRRLTIILSILVSVTFVLCYFKSRYYMNIANRANTI